MIPTNQFIQQFIATIEAYLDINTRYRRTGARNPLLRQELRQTRNQAYHAAQTQNAALHQHLLKLNEPTDPIITHARELIRRWDARNTCYQNLIHLTADDNPREAITRLDKAERHLREQITLLQQTIKIASTN